MQRAEGGWEKLNNVGTNYELWEPYLLIFFVHVCYYSFFRGFKVQFLTIFFSHVCY